MKNVRKLTEGAILLAVFMVLLVLTVYVPLVGMIVNLFLPIPFILFAAKNDWKSTVVFVTASFLLSFIVGTILSLPLTMLYGITGAVMGFIIQRKKNWIVVLISGSFAFLVNTIIIYAASIVFFNVNLIDQMIEMIRDSFAMSAEMLKGFGNQENVNKTIEEYKKGLDQVKTLVPTLFVLFSFFTVLLIQLVSYPIIKRFGITIKKWKSFKEITLPKSLLWYYLITLIASMLIKPEVGTYGYSVIINLTYILQFLMVFQGYTFLFYFFHKKGISKPISITIVIVTFIIPIFLYIVAILGIIDLGFDLRKNDGKKV